MKLFSQSQGPVVIAAPAQAFFHLILSPEEEVFNLSFSVKQEDNIRFYLVEGSHDLITFHKLTRIHAKGAHNLPHTYKATIYETTYSYYRVRQIDEATAATIAATTPAELFQPDRTKPIDLADLDFDNHNVVIPMYAF